MSIHMRRSVGDLRLALCVCVDLRSNEFGMYCFIVLELALTSEGHIYVGFSSGKIGSVSGVEMRDN